MPRVTPVPEADAVEDIRPLYQSYGRNYGPFETQVGVFAHVPPALRHLMPMIQELTAAKSTPRRYIELAIVTVAKLNECEYCVDHHKPMLAVEGLSAEAADRILEYQDHPDLDEADKLVVEYAIAVETKPQYIRDNVFERLRKHFSESQIVELTIRSALCGFFNRVNDSLMIEDAVPHHTAAAE